MTGNTFSSGPTGYFGVSVHFSQRWGMVLIIDLQYAIGMASHVNATVTGNDAREGAAPTSAPSNPGRALP